MSGLRRRGQAFNIGDILKGRRKHLLAIPCPACPEVHVNVDLEMIEQAKEDEM